MENLEKRREAERIMDEKYPMFCPCGRLATGLHTSHCRIWKARENEIYKKLMK